MKYPAIINELTRRIGLNPESLGDHAIDTAIDSRMRYHGLKEQSAYAMRLTSDHLEFQKLINDIVVSETWFFRGVELFETIAKHVRQLASNRSTGNPIRILSVACSTGEEPYSLAMMFEQAGISASSYRIDAVDVSSRNLEIAKAGSYGEFSFRQIDRTIRDVFFIEKANHQWALDTTIRSKVKFRLGNLMDTNFLIDEAPYDVILCRNVFIYFTAEARRTALRHFERLLCSTGILGMGHAESSDLTEPRWTRFGPETACLFQRCVEPTSEHKPASKPSGSETSSIAKTFLTSGSTIQSKSPINLKSPITAAKRRVPLPVTSPSAKSADGSDCWNIIGVRGDRSCKELSRYDHCHNCHVYSTAGRRFLDNIPPSGYLDEWTKRLAEPMEDQGQDLANVLIFRIRDEWLALPVACITEVTQPRSFHRIPHRGGLLEGIINVRGEIHLLVRVDELLGLSSPGQESQITMKSRMILAGTPSNLWAFTVCEVDRVRSVRIGEMSAIPATVARSTVRFSRGVIVGNERSTGLLDDAKLFDALRVRLT